MKIIIELDSIAELMEVSRALSKFRTAVDAEIKHFAELGITVRAKNCLLNAGVSSMEELAAMTDADLMKLPNFGRRDLVDVRAALAKIAAVPADQQGENMP
jgi:DNA-directed RNA polymerase alpha subunit